MVALLFGRRCGPKDLAVPLAPITELIVRRPEDTLDLCGKMSTCICFKMIAIALDEELASLDDDIDGELSICDRSAATVPQTTIGRSRCRRLVVRTVFTSISGSNL
jgi:hypothetical protein